jgi:methylmalonyl-CoA mutase C-terminal domain/subunit
MTGRGRVLMAKTSLDGHWRGVHVVAQALREAGFEVIVIGMATADDIVSAATQEDADLIGLNVGGHVAIVERVLDALDAAGLTAPVIAGGTIPPSAKRRLEARGVPCFPPGSSLDAIVTEADRLVRAAPA